MVATLKLTDIAIEGAKLGESVFKMPDGGGFHLILQPSSGKLCCYKFRFNGVEKKISLGKCPDVSLHVARKCHQLARGIDPSTAWGPSLMHQLRGPQRIGEQPW